MATTWLRSAVSVVIVCTAVGCGGGGERGQSTGNGRAAIRSSTDWPMYGFDVAQSRFNAGETGIAAGNVASLKQVWFHATGGPVSATPAVVGGTVYVGAWDHRFYALEAADGVEQWRIQLATPQGDKAGYPGIQSSAAVFGGRVYFGDSCGYLHAYPADGSGAQPTDLTTRNRGCASSGREAQGFPVDLGGALPSAGDAEHTDIFSSPIPYTPKHGANAGRHMIYVGASSHVDQPCIHGALFALDADSGAIVWRFDVVPAKAIGGAVWSTPAIDADDDLVYVDTGDCVQNGSSGFSESIIALDASCSGATVDGSCAALPVVVYPPFAPGSGPSKDNPVWAFQSHPNGEIADFDFGSSPNVITDSSGEPALIGAGSKDGAYYAVHAGRGSNGGQLAWSTRIVDLQTAATTLSIGTSIGTVAGGFQGSTSFAYGKIFGTTVSGPEFHVALDAFSGSLKWNALDATTSFSSVAVANGLVFAGDSLGILKARDESTGLVRFLFPLGAPVLGGPSVADGMVFVGVGLPTSQLPGIIQGVYAFGH